MAFFSLNNLNQHLINICCEQDTLLGTMWNTKPISAKLESLKFLASTLLFYPGCYNKIAHTG